MVAEHNRPEEGVGGGFDQGTPPDPWKSSLSTEPGASPEHFGAERGPKPAYNLGGDLSPQ